ncbi:MAG: hypothetical protein JEY96_01495 [Bacteroidales bacterium]|nr:hypothetical protein [Bacteroidales bacterium]
MISENIIKGRFIAQVLDRDAKFINKEQAQVVQDYNLFGPNKKLYQTLINQSQGHFSLSVNESSAKLTLRYLKYLRFLDIKDVKKNRANYHLYNRIVFGRIYNETLAGLKYGYTKSVQQGLEAELMELAKTNPYLAAAGFSKLRH